MHRIDYKKEDLDKLVDALTHVLEQIHMHWSARLLVENLLRELRVCGYGPPDMWHRRIPLMKHTSDTLYDGLRKVCPVNNKRSNYYRNSIRYGQCAFQTIYHLPYKELPLMISHKSPVIRAIVSWRLTIGK